MKVSLRSLSCVPCLALLLAVAPAAHAQYSVSGEVWEGGTTGDVPVLGSSVYSSTATAVFTVTNTLPGDLFSFNSNGSTLEGPRGAWFAFLIDLKWCRFTRHGWYESGGRFLESVASPMEENELR